jgi:hypothetical protein
VQKTGAKLKINDMSLHMGGVFDICGEWDPDIKCPVSSDPTKLQSGHQTHRKGTSVDINTTAISVSSGDTTKTNRFALGQIISKPEIGGYFFPEASIHVEFK